jgi:hypothetical protein
LGFGSLLIQSVTFNIGGNVPSRCFSLVSVTFSIALLDSPTCSEGTEGLAFAFVVAVCSDSVMLSSIRGAATFLFDLVFLVTGFGALSLFLTALLLRSSLGGKEPFWQEQEVCHV